MIMAVATTAAESLKKSRLSLGVSQSKLARLSGVSRFKICTFELGGTSFTIDDHRRIATALTSEAARLCAVAAQLTLNKIELTEGE
jgi:predicted transcriptional regulator